MLDKTLQQPVVIIGMGEMGGVFARGFLRSGHPVYPITRDIDMAPAVTAIPEPSLVLVAVAEGDLDAVLDHVPVPWRDRLGLLQNELLPDNWQRHHIVDPTVIAVWFEKKKGQDVKVLLSSPASGPHAELAVAALNAIDIPSHSVNDEAQMLYELVRKNVYILTTNIAGIVSGGTVAELWQQHHDLALKVAHDVIDIQHYLTKAELSPQQLINGMVEAIEGDPHHQCKGRSAPARLARALHYADEAGLRVETLRHIAQHNL